MRHKDYSCLDKVDQQKNNKLFGNGEIDVTKQTCLWCKRTGNEEDMIDCGNEGLGSMWYHEDCYDEAMDNQ